MRPDREVKPGDRPLPQRVLSTSEKDAEQWCAEHLSTVCRDQSVELVGRQVTLPHNRVLDLLGYSRREHRYLVVEVKAMRIRPRHISQVLDYMGDLRISTSVDGSRVGGVLVGTHLMKGRVQRLVAAVDNLSFFHLDLEANEQGVEGLLSGYPFADPRKQLRTQEQIQR